MKDFDIARDERSAQDRDFRIGGESFRMKSAVRPEAMIGYEGLTGETSALDALRVVDDMVISFLEGADAEARYRKLRERDEDPVSMDDLNALVEWLVTEQTGRPTQVPSPSSGGHESTGASSTDGPVLAAVT